MDRKRKIRYGAAFLFLGISVLIFIILNICIGSVRIPLSDILESLMGHEISNGRILWDIRMPRAMAAMILGGALALAGYLLQTFFHNPIAGPFVLGISSGAKMVVALVMVFLMGQSVRVSSGTLIMAAFIGAMISMGFVLLMSRKVSNMSMLVVSGVMIGYICSAITELVITFANDADIVNLMHACDILLSVIEEDRPCGYVENIGREGTRAVTCTLKELRETQVNMFTTVFIGNSGSEIINGKLITKRGYQIEGNTHICRNN